MLMIWRGVTYLHLDGYVYITNTARLPFADWIATRERGAVFQTCGFMSFGCRKNA